MGAGRAEDLTTVALSLSALTWCPFFPTNTGIDWMDSIRWPEPADSRADPPITSNQPTNRLLLSSNFWVR